MDLVGILLGAVIGAAGTAGVMTLFRFLSTRRRPVPIPLPLNSSLAERGVELPGEPEATAHLPPPSPLGPASDSGPGVSANGARPVAPAGPGPDRPGIRGRKAPTESFVAEAPPSNRPSKETLRLSHRIVLHLARQGFVPETEVAPVGLSQVGMVDELGVTQSALTKVLQRLEAARVVSVSRGHVRGQARRLKVYRLTSLGESLSKELRSRTPTGPARRTSSDSPSSIYR